MLKASALFAVLVAVATMPGINAIQPGQADLQDPPEAPAKPYPTGGGVSSNENSGNSGGGDDGGKLVITPTKNVDPSYLRYLPPKEKAPAPTGSKRMIHPIGRPDLCLRVQGGEFIEGATVGISYCLDDLDQTKVWQQWEGDIEKNGVLSITDGDKTFCLGGGQGRYDATRPRLMQCGEKDEALRALRAVNGVAFKPGDKYQVKMTGDGSGETYCLDIREQSAQYHGTNWISERDVQIWVCADKDEPKGNQAWTMQRKEGSMAGDAKNRPDDYGRRRRSRV